MVPPPVAAPGAGAPIAAIGNSTWTVPAFSNCSVAATVLPGSSGCLRSRNIMCTPAGLSMTLSPGLTSSPPSTGRIFMTPFSMVMLWIWHLALASLETQLRRSGVVPLLVTVM
jgi:hypothetical protein